MRFGVLGTGHWARTVHAAALAGHPTAELVGVWGRDPAKAEELGAEFEVPGFADLAALLDRVDSVAIAVPPSVQVGLAEQAAAAGRHLLLEKPIGLSLDEADRVVTAVRSAGVASVVFFTFRFQAGTSTWLTQAARTRLAELLDAFGATRDVATISIAYGAEPLPELRMVTYRQGIKHERLLAYCHPHGQWLDWRDELSAWGDET